MFLKRWWGNNNSLTHLRLSRFRRGIHAAQEFRALLAWERARVDRNGHQFSLIVFDASQIELNGFPNGNWLSIITSRIRSTDVAGWLAERCLGVFLPDTPTEGAAKLADELCQALAARTSFPPVCKVYTYPSPRHFSGDDQDHADSLEDFLVNRPPLWKRTTDIAGALTAFIVLSPIFLLIALAIKLVSPGPVFFTQPRIGYLGRPFKFWKFRTMHVHSDSSVHQQHLANLISSNQPMTKLDKDNDQRIIPLGKLLRASSLDELPQLINVLRGEMSLVGPRPCLLYEANKYRRWQTRRFDAVPGMTGLWQVSGKNRTTFQEMIQLDIAYAMKQSLGLDLKIIFKTIPVILTQVFDNYSKRKEKGYQYARIA